MTATGNGASVSAGRATIAKAVGPGPARLLIRAKGRKKAVLDRAGKVKLSIAITYTPTGGTAGTQRLKVKLKKL